MCRSAAGAQAFVLLSSETNGGSGDPLPSVAGPLGPMLVGGIGYDWPLRGSSWSAAGVFVRADVTCLFASPSPWFPVGLFAGVSIAHF